jgi:hypothetical protein
MKKCETCGSYIIAQADIEELRTSSYGHPDPVGEPGVLGVAGKKYKYKFNINYHMYVKLTDFGKARIIEKNGADYFKYCVESTLQDDGYYKLQAHTVMQLLGEYLYNGARNLPFDPTVYFDFEDLELDTTFKPVHWRVETDEEEPNPMFKHVVCSACGQSANEPYKYCPECGAKMRGIEA